MIHKKIKHSTLAILMFLVLISCTKNEETKSTIIEKIKTVSFCQKTNLSPTVDFNYKISENTWSVIIDYDKPISIVDLYDHDIITSSYDFKNDKISNKSFSMRPTIDYKDSLIVYTPKSEKEIYVGDIIAFYLQIENKHIIHRVIRKENGFFYTKGDNNLNEDKEPVKFENIRYKVIGVIYR